jgi:hypothetical protein
MNDKVYDQREDLHEARKDNWPTEKSEIPVPRSPVPGSNDKGWMNESVKRANASLIEQVTPLELAARTGRQVTIPLNDTDAAELLRRFNAHYFAWTGKCLKEAR